MSGELGVYASFLKDALYAVSAVFLFWIAKWPLQWVYYFHALTWAAFAMYTFSNDLSFWAPTGAAVVSVAVGALDAFALVNLVCYLPGANCSSSSPPPLSVHLGRTGEVCCIGSSAYAPFTLGATVCGPNDRYDPATLVWLAIVAVGIGVLTNVSRTVGIYNTRQGARRTATLSPLRLTFPLRNVHRNTHSRPVHHPEGVPPVLVGRDVHPVLRLLEHGHHGLPGKGVPPLNPLAKELPRGVADAGVWGRCRRSQPISLVSRCASSPSCCSWWWC